MNKDNLKSMSTVEICKNVLLEITELQGRGLHVVIGGDILSKVTISDLVASEVRDNQ